MIKTHSNNSVIYNQTDTFHKFLEKHYWILLLVGYIAITIFWVVRLDLKLLFQDTVLTGGDSCSWHQIAHTMRYKLLPAGRLFGWTQDNYFGYEALQHYFVPPFLVASLLSFFMPLTIALKITTLLGLYFTPLVTFFSIKKITRNVWAAWAGMFLILIFIFNESYTMFGGNFLSTLAGEFCYSFAMTIFIIFIGVCYRTIVDNKNPVWAGLLLGLVGLSHFFIFMPAFFIPFFFVLARRPWFIPPSKKVSATKKRDTPVPVNKNSLGATLKNVLVIYLVAILLMAFWLLPMVAKRSFTTELSTIWKFDSFKTFFQQSFMTLIIIGVVTTTILAFIYKGQRRAPFMLAFGLCASLFFYLIAPWLGIPDIRFIPPALVFSLFAIAILLHAFFIFWNKYNLPRLEIFFTATIIIIVTIITWNLTRNVGGWFSWNYTGYENKREYSTLHTLKNNSGGDANSGRLLWEKLHSKDNGDFGSERGFENLSYFTGRPSAEGVLYGSSFMARATTYMQSEYSPLAVDPEPWRIYSKINPYVWPFRFYQVNAKDIIVYTDEMKEKFEAHPDFVHSYDSGRFSVFSFNACPDSYIQPVDPENLHIVRDNEHGFTKDFYRFFRDYELIDHPFIPSSFADDLPQSYSHFESYDKLRERYDGPLPPFEQWRAEHGKHAVITSEDVTDRTIKFSTSAVGKPHIIKISYSPNFRSSNGEKIYPVAPGFMCIIPEQSQVEINFEWIPIEIIGLLLSLLCIPLVITSIYYRSKIQLLELPLPRLLYTGTVLFFIFTAAALLFMSLTRSLSLEHDYERAQNAFHQQQDYQKTLQIVTRHTTTSNLEEYDNHLIFNYIVLKAWSLTKLKRHEEALDILNRLMDRYRHSRANDYAGNIKREVERSIQQYEESRRRHDKTE